MTRIGWNEWIALGALALSLACSRPIVVDPAAEPNPRIVRTDALTALWGYYKFHYIENGRVVSLDEDRITTSEGQGYAMLRAVWSDDRETFDAVWRWTNEHLRGRGTRSSAGSGRAGFSTPLPRRTRIPTSPSRS